MADSKKEAYRKYLESAGVVDALTKVLVALYEEPDKPKVAVDYIKTVLGAPTGAEYDAIVAERDALKKQLEESQQRVTELEAQIRNASEAATPEAEA